MRHNAQVRVFRRVRWLIDRGSNTKSKWTSLVVHDHEGGIRMAVIRQPMAESDRILRHQQPNGACRAQPKVVRRRGPALEGPAPTDLSGGQVVPILGGFVSAVVHVVSLVVWALLMIKAWQGERYMLPMIGEMAEERTRAD